MFSKLRSGPQTNPSRRLFNDELSKAMLSVGVETLAVVELGRNLPALTNSLEGSTPMCALPQLP